VPVPAVDRVHGDLVDAPIAERRQDVLLEQLPVMLGRARLQLAHLQPVGGVLGEQVAAEVGIRPLPGADLREDLVERRLCVRLVGERACSTAGWLQQAATRCDVASGPVGLTV
jgi:hypothetical protein